MKKNLFGKDRDRPSKEDLEREAAAELQRLTQRARPPGGFSSGPPSPSGVAPPGPSYGSPGSTWQPLPDEDDEDEANFVENEGAAVTDLAVRQWAERRGAKAKPEDFVRDPGFATSAEAARDRALREFFDRQARMARERPVPRTTDPLRAAGERTRGTPAGPPPTTGGTGARSRPTAWATRATTAGAEPAGAKQASTRKAAAKKGGAEETAKPAAPRQAARKKDR